MNKNTKKHLKLKLLPVSIILLASLITFSIAYLLTLIPIKNIIINGNNYLSDQEIIEFAKIDNYPSFLKTFSRTIKSEIEKNEYIKNVKVTKKGFGKVIINIEEKNILFRKEENNLLVLEDGSEINDNNKYIVPILLNYIPDTKYNVFLAKMNEVDVSIKNQISEIRYYPNEQDEDRFLLYMIDGNYVYLTLTKFKQINYFEDALSRLNGKKGIFYLDSGNLFKIMSD